MQVTGFVCLELIKLIQRGGKAQFKDLQVLFTPHLFIIQLFREAPPSVYGRV